jgi:hypothetical protein
MDPREVARSDGRLRDEAIQPDAAVLDCFAPLAMTLRELSTIFDQARGWAAR